MRNLMGQILARHTGQPLKKVSRETDRDFIMTAEEARAYGIVDVVLTGREQSGPLEQQLAHA